MRFVLISLIAVLAFLSSCTVTHEVYFNKDWSGSFKYELETGDMDLGSLDSSSGFIELDELEGILEAEEGLSNVVVSQDTVQNSVTFSVDFADLDVLNDVMALVMMTDSSGIGVENEPTFKLKGNKLEYNLLQADETVSTDDDALTEQMKGLSSAIKFNLKLGFEREVKKVKSKNSAKKLSDGKTVVWNTDMGMIEEGKEKSKIIVVLK